MLARLTLILAMLATFLTACSGGDSSPTPASTATSPAAITLTPPVATPALPTLYPPVTPSPKAIYPLGTRTGVGVVDAVIAAAEAHDVNALVGLIHYYELPCTPSTGVGVVPCQAGAEPGTPSVVVGGGQCEGNFIAKGDPVISQAMDNFLNDPNPPVFDAHLHAVIKRPPFAREPQIPGDYLIVFASAHAIEVDSQGMTYYLFPCGLQYSADAYVSGGAAVPGQTFLLPPR